MKDEKPPIYNLEVHAALQRLGTSPSGLSDREVKRRFKKWGANEITPKPVPILRRIFEPFASVFVGVLLIALLISIAEGETTEAIIIAVIVGINAIIYYVQQYSVSRVLATLKGKDIQMVEVVRDGATVRISARELVLGDIVHIKEGIKVPADGRLIESNQIEADEALLTGESLPVRKHAASIDGQKELYDQANMLFSGTYIATGAGLMAVSGVGLHTEFGTITDLTSRVDTGQSPIEEKLDAFTRRLIIVILITAVFVLALSIWRGVAIEEAVRFSLVVIVSAVPEGLPVALAIVLLLSARRMAKAKALVKKISSIETMGAVTMIATDKTGTITQNNLMVTEMYAANHRHGALERAMRATINGTAGSGADVLDTILHRALGHHGIMPASWSRVRNFSFSQSLRMSGVLWQHSGGFTLYMKGSPEHIIKYCRPDAAARNAIEDLTSRGYRTIAIAHKDFAHPLDKLETHHLSGMTFDGFVGLSDPIRPHIAASVAEAQRAGIKVVMLTGDHVNTARFIAGRVGIAKEPEQTTDSAVLENDDAKEIRETLETTRAFGRVLPEHKYALLKATKHYEITAMTGDGVNDIPALAEADAGIAMGSGSDAAKDAADIVLVNNNFTSIVAAVRIGRTALANIRKMVVYVVSTGAGEVLTMLGSLLIGVPLPVAAIQILWINLVTDGVSVIPLGLSPAEEDQMRQAPPHPRAPLLNVRQVTRIAAISLMMSVSVISIFVMNLPKGHAYAQTLAFLSLIVVQWASAISLNFEFKPWIYNFIRPNIKLWIGIGVSIVLQALVFLTPFGRFLEVVPIGMMDALIAIVIPAAVVSLTVELHKLVWHWIDRRI